MALTGIGALASGLGRGLVAAEGRKRQQAADALNALELLGRVPEEQEDIFRALLTQSNPRLAKVLPSGRIPRAPKPFGQRRIGDVGLPPEAIAGLDPNMTWDEALRVRPELAEHYSPRMRSEREKAEQELAYQQVQRQIAAWQSRYGKRPLPPVLLEAAKRVGYPVATKETDETTPLTPAPQVRDPKEGEPTGPVQVPTGKRTVVEDTGEAEDKPILVSIPGIGVVDMRKLPEGAQSAIIREMFRPNASVRVTITLPDGRKMTTSQKEADRIVANLISREQAAVVQVKLPNGQVIMVTPSEYAQIKNAMKSAGGGAGGAGAPIPVVTIGPDGVPRVTGVMPPRSRVVTPRQPTELTEKVGGRSMTLAQIEDEIDATNADILQTDHNAPEMTQYSQYLQRLMQARERLKKRIAAGKAGAPAPAGSPEDKDEEDVDDLYPEE